MKNILIVSIILLLLITTLNAFDKGSPLMNAVDNQNFEEVVKLVESGVDINQKNDIGFTALLFATGWGDVKIVKYLIEHGASLDAKANIGFGVIHRAAMNKNSSVLKYLLENYTLNINDRAKSYCSPLDFALRGNALQEGGSLENARLLIAKGAQESINWRCNGYTPLMVAVPDKKVINFLIQNGADKTIKNEAGLTVYNMAKRQNAPADVLTMLATGTEQKSKINKQIFQSATLLWELKTNQNRYNQVTEDEATKYCANLNIEGYSNWRIPSIAEYQTILSEKPYKGFVIDGIDEYYMNPKDFPNMTPSTYWVILKDKSLGYQSISWNKVHKKREDNEKHHIRCVHTK